MKMALKDWKRKKKIFFNVPYTWVNKDTVGLIEISFTNYDAFGNNLGEYKVYSNIKNFYPKFFKTEKQALSFAKQYMRSH